jgi:predicted ribosome quality control (RQC) complex YloA/Tae2 family protein
MSSTQATSKPEETTQQLDPTPTTNTTATERVSGTVGSAKDNVQGSTGEKQQSEESALAQKIGDIIANALERIKPVTDMINKTLDNAERDQRNDKLDEAELVRNMKPLLEQGTQILNETHGAIKALDPSGNISRNAKNKSAAHQATSEEYYLAEKLSQLTENVQKTIDNAQEKIKDMPKAKKEIHPLLIALQNPLVQIVSAVGLLLAGVLNLVRQILSGLGLGGLIDNLLGAVGLNKLVDSLGLGSILGGGSKK